MPRNKLTDLNDHLMAQMERLGDEELSAEDFDKEVKRAKAMSGIASNIVNNAKVMLEGTKLALKEGLTKDQGLVVWF